MFFAERRGGDEYDNRKPISAGRKRYCLFLIQSEEIRPVCPFCKTVMQQYGRRWRTALSSDGQKFNLYIRRLKCPRCLCIHHELPDFLIPYKRYLATCIEMAIEKQYDCLSCENSTIYRWHIWFQYLRIKIQISSLNFHKKGWLPRLIFLLLKTEK